MDEKGRVIEFKAKALVKDDTDFFIWENCKVVRWRPSDNLWVVEFEDGEQMKLKRLQLLFDVEDKAVFVDRLTRAIVERIYMDSKIRYEFYINSMPTKDLGELSSTSANRIVKSSKNSRKLRENGSLDVEGEVASINVLFKRSMNKILFNKYLSENDGKNDMLPNQLILPELERGEAQEAPEKGMIATEKAEFTYEPKGEDYSYPSSKEFTETFQEVCLESVYSRNCSILALQDIKALCLDVSRRDVFKIKLDKAVKYDDFRQEQQIAIKKLVF